MRRKRQKLTDLTAYFGHIPNVTCATHTDFNCTHSCDSTVNLPLQKRDRGRASKFVAHQQIQTRACCGARDTCWCTHDRMQAEIAHPRPCQRWHANCNML